MMTRELAPSWVPTITSRSLSMSTSAILTAETTMGAPKATTLVFDVAALGSNDEVVVRVLVYSSRRQGSAFADWACRGFDLEPFPRMAATVRVSIPPDVAHLRADGHVQVAVIVEVGVHALEEGTRP